MARNSSNFIRNTIILLDFIIVNAVVSIYYYYVLDKTPSFLLGVSLPFLLLLTNGALAIAQLFFSTIVHGHYKSIDKVLRQICMLSVSFGIFFICLIEVSRYLFKTESPNISFTLWAIGISVISLVIVRLLEYVFLKKIRLYGRNSRVIVFVGDSKLIADAYEEFNFTSHAGLRIYGYYSDTEIPAEKNLNLRHLGTLADFKEGIEKNSKRIADDIYCTDIPGATEFITEIVDYCMCNAIQFNYIPPFLNDFGYCLKPRTEGELVVFSNLNEPLQSLGNRILKRSFDILVSGVAIICVAPFVPIIGAIIKISSPGPIFFKQKRTGLNGEDFYMLKFRSMHVNKDADKIQATKDDPRKFAFGNFMRKTNIDELPQVFNVFLGDMSIVGPRPHMLAHTDEYRKKIYEYMLRHLVRPGITGWAQVTGFRGETPELWQMEGRVQRDLWYIQNWSFWLDIRIIFRTAYLTLVHDKNAF